MCPAALPALLLALYLSLFPGHTSAGTGRSVRTTHRCRNARGNSAYWPAYRSHQTRQFARMAGFEPKHTAVRSPESNGMAESFVKTMKRDYISIMSKTDGLTAVKNLAEAFEHYNEWHPHSALGYRSPREYLRRRTSNGLSDKKCMEI